MSIAPIGALETRVAALAARDLGIAVEILKEAIRLPADRVDLPHDQGGDPECGLSNHEGPRIEYLKRALIAIGGVARPEDAAIDPFGNLVWTLEDPADPTPRDAKRVIFWDGHCDTVRALRDQWRSRLGGGVDPYLGWDGSAIDRAFLRRELGWLPPDQEWAAHLLFGRGAADQLGGVVSQLVASRILRELAPEGALEGVILRSYVTVAEEDNDGGGPLYITRHTLAGGAPEELPDVVILTEGTGDSREGALGIYRGQRGRMQIELEVIGRSCHGSMPWEGLNPLEFGGAIVAEAARAYEAREGFLDHPFLGHGTRTASDARLETPSDCAVPERLVVRFDRRLTVGETPEQALADVERLERVREARAAGLEVRVTVPRYQRRTWHGYPADNPQFYMGWVTPEEHPALQAAVETYRRVISPGIPAGNGHGGALKREPRVGRWVFSTDGVGFPVPVNDQSFAVPGRKHWVVSGAVRHPAMFGLGPGIEQNTHKIGECVDTRELERAIAFLAGYPALFAAREA